MLRVFCHLELSSSSSSNDIFRHHLKIQYFQQASQYPYSAFLLAPQFRLPLTVYLRLYIIFSCIYLRKFSYFCFLSAGLLFVLLCITTSRSVKKKI